jgi:hypothetical protein
MLFFIAKTNKRYEKTLRKNRKNRKKGRDSTDVILAYHPDWVIAKKMPHLCIGDLDPVESSCHQNANSAAISASYRQLDARIRMLGLYDTDYSFFIREAIKFVVLWACVFYFALVHPGSTVSVLTSAVLCAVLWHQGAFVSHDGNYSTFVSLFVFFYWCCGCSRGKALVFRSSGAVIY